MFTREIFRRDSNVDILFLFGIDVLNESVFYEIVKRKLSLLELQDVLFGNKRCPSLDNYKRPTGSSGIRVDIDFVRVFVISNIYQMRKLAASSFCSKLVNKLFWIAVRSL